MTKKIILGVMTVALVAFAAAPSASAACIPAQDAKTGTAYWLTVAERGVLSGQAWQLGAPGTFAGTGCVDFVYFYPGAPGASVNLNLGGCGSGCPAPLSTLAVLGMNSTTSAGTDFFLATAPQTPAEVVFFNFEPLGTRQMIKMPRPRVLSSSRTANNVNLSVAIDSIAAGLAGPNVASAVTGFNILTASSATDPGTDASAYSLRSTVLSPGGAAVTQPVTLDCTNLQDQWLVTQIQFENGTVLSSSVSAATRVRCNPALANPKTPPKVKVAPKVLQN